MRRADRLFEIIQILRRARGPLTAATIAAELEIGRRTVYRDVAALVAQRVPIRGEAGVGYVLEGGFDVPPLMFTSDEIEATVLGAQWVVAHGDAALARAAASVLAKVAAVVPTGLRGAIDDPVVAAPPTLGERRDAIVDVARLRAWSHQGRKLAIRYVDEGGRASERTIWPFLIGYVETTQILATWCELRQDFRVFRADRLREVTFLDERYPGRRTDLRRRFLAMLSDRRTRVGKAPARASG